MKLKAEFETETYINADGYYVIQQSVPGEEGSILGLSRSQAELIASELTELLKMPKWGMSEDE